MNYNIKIKLDYKEKIQVLLNWDIRKSICTNDTRMR